MDFDVERNLGAVARQVVSGQRDGQPVRKVVLERSYDTDRADLWDALTRAERIARWFAPVQGELRLGGRYQIEGNAGGTVNDCTPPERLGLTWEFGGEVSWVDAELTEDGPDRTRLRLTHTVPVNEHWASFGPGAVGVGWELGLAGLALHLDAPDAPRLDEAALAASDAGKAFVTRSADAWGEAAIEGGDEAEAARASAARTAASYRGDAAPGG